LQDSKKKEKVIKVENPEESKEEVEATTKKVENAEELKKTKKRKIGQITGGLVEPAPRRSKRVKLNKD